MWWLVNATTRPIYLRGRPDTHFTAGCVDQKASQDGVENVTTTVIRSPDRSGCSQAQ